MLRIQVLIAAYGSESLKRIASLSHPVCEGVEYIVSWQNSSSGTIPDSLARRPDFKIIVIPSMGLCNNRNTLLEATDADIAVISDDDLEYGPQHFEIIREAYRENPDRHFLTFRYDSMAYVKQYPSFSFSFDKVPKGYFVTSMELTLNIRKIKEDGLMNVIRFNPAFGVNGTHFGSGEEDILLAKMLRSGLKGKFIPETICFNTLSTTSDRISHTRGFVQTKGAVMKYVKPNSWPLRMFTHAWREQKSEATDRPSFFQYCQWWIEGVRIADQNKVFENP